MLGSGAMTSVALCSWLPWRLQHLCRNSFRPCVGVAGVYSSFQGLCDFQLSLRFAVLPEVVYCVVDHAVRHWGGFDTLTSKPIYCSCPSGRTLHAPRPSDEFLDQSSHWQRLLQSSTCTISFTPSTDVGID